MSNIARCRCRSCQVEFEARWGGGFRYADRFCSKCGAWRCVQYAEDTRTWEAFHALVMTSQDTCGPSREWQQRVARAATHLEDQVQVVLGECVCGGSFTGEAPRCPACASDEVEPVGQVLLDYD